MLADTVEFPRAAFTATQTEDGVDGRVGNGAGVTWIVELEGTGTVEFVGAAGGVGTGAGVIGIVELEGIGTVEFVGVTGVVVGIFGGNDVVVVLLVVCEICA